MGIKNLTEAEEKEFYRLVGKMNGKEPDKKQDAKVKKPQYGDTVYYINYIGRIRKRKETNRGFNRKWDYKRCRIYEIYTGNGRT